MVDGVREACQTCMYMYVGDVWRWCHSQDAAAAAFFIPHHWLPNCRWIPMLASSLAFSFSSGSAANQSSTHTLRNKLLISAFVVVAAAAAADPNALFILRSCSKSKETTKKERNKEVLLLLLIPTALLILRRCKRKKERKKERNSFQLIAGFQCSFDF